MQFEWWLWYSTPPVKSKLQGRIVHRQGDSRQHDMLLCKMKHPLKNVFKVTHYVSVKHNHLCLFKYSHMFGSVQTIIRTSLQYFEGKGKIHYNCIRNMGSRMFYNICYNIKLYKIVKDWFWQLLWNIRNPIVWIQLCCILPCLKNIVLVAWWWSLQT
jgi:hypothetical protein